MSLTSGPTVVPSKLPKVQAYLTCDMVHVVPLLACFPKDRAMVFETKKAFSHSSSQILLMVAVDHSDHSALMQTQLSGNAGGHLGTAPDLSLLTSLVPAETPVRAAALALLPPPCPPPLVHLSAPPRKPCLSAGRVHFPLGCTPLSSSYFPVGPSFPLPAVLRGVRSLKGCPRLQGQNDAEPHCLGFSGKLLLLSRPARQAQAVTRGEGMDGGVGGARGSRDPATNAAAGKSEATSRSSGPKSSPAELSLNSVLNR